MTQQAYRPDAGPFIITTRRPVDAVDAGHPDAPRNGWPVSRRAVATLAEARAAAAEIVESITSDDEPFFATAMLATPGTVGPLPDGTVIEVEPGPGQQQMRQHLREWGVWMDTRDALDDTIVFAWVTAYNAAQAEGLMT